MIIELFFIKSNVSELDPTASFIEVMEQYLKSKVGTCLFLPTIQDLNYDIVNQMDEDKKDEIPEEPVTPNADAVEAFLAHQRRIQYGEKLNPEEAREEAKKLAILQNELVKLLETYPKEHRHIGQIIPGVFLETNPFSLRISSHIERLQGIGGKFIIFVHGFKVYPNDLPQHVGVKSQNRLDIGVHTDPPTKAAIERLNDPRAINILQSIYFFDEEGNYGKVISLPKDILDSRENIGPGGVIQKYVKAEMTIGDFDLARASLEMLIKRLRL